MDERKKELVAVLLGISLCVSVFGYSAYYVYFSNREYTVEFQVFEANYWNVRGRRETQILTWGVGKFYFIGNWTGQFMEGHTYLVTYVQKPGSAIHTCNNLIVLEWEEVV